MIQVKNTVLKNQIWLKISILLCILFNSIFPSILKSQELENSLISHYEFSNNFLDSSPNQLHGTGDGTSFTDDRFGGSNNALYFSGNGCFNLPQDPRLKPQFPFSVSLWFNLGELVGRDGVHYSLFGSDQTTNNYHGAHITVLSRGEILIGYGDASGCTSTSCRKGIQSLSKIEVNEWYHIVAVFEDPTTFQLYLNGCILPSENSGTGSNSIVYSDTPGAIGKYDHTSFSNLPLSYFYGAIDDFYFWNRVISEEEVSILNDNFHMPVKDFVYDGCIGDGFEVNFDGEVFNEQNSSGTAFLSTSIGCDTMVNVSLNFTEKIDSTITYRGCVGDGFELNLNNQSFNELNPEGEVLLNAAIGCDTSVVINLEFSENYDSLVSYSGLEGDGFNLNIDNNIFDEDNPSGLITVANEFGCDTVFTVNLEFRRIKDCEYYIPNIMSVSDSGLLNSTHLILTEDDCSVEYLQYSVFDRWGNKVYQKNEAWNGKMQNNLLGEGIYSYLIKFRLDQDIIEETGTVLIIK